jgi:hypothetical protein
MVDRGTGSKTNRHRAVILLKADEGEHRPRWTDAKIAEAFDVGVRTVERTRWLLVTEGFDAVLARKPLLSLRSCVILLLVDLLDRHSCFPFRCHSGVPKPSLEQKTLQIRFSAQRFGHDVPTVASRHMYYGEGRRDTGRGAGPVKPTGYRSGGNRRTDRWGIRQRRLIDNLSNSPAV